MAGKGATSTVDVNSLPYRLCVGVMVLNNEDLNQVTWEQRVMEGNPKFEATQRLPDVPYHKFAQLIGLDGIFCDDAEQVGAAWDQALAARRPVVLEMKTDPNVPPLPPHITLAQAKNSSAEITGLPYSRAFRALPDWVPTSATTRRSQLVLVTFAAGTSPAAVARRFISSRS